MPKAPAPASATLIVFASLRVLQDQMADGGVATRARGRSGARPSASAPPATSAIAPRAISHITSSMPSRAGLAHVLDVRHLRQPVRVGDQPVEEARCPTPC